MFYIPVIGALLESIGMIIEKKTLKKKNINYRNYSVYSFLAIVCVIIPFLFFFWKLSKEAFLALIYGSGYVMARAVVVDGKLPQLEQGLDGKYVTRTINV